MRKIFRWLGIILGSLLGLAVLLLIVFFVLGNSRLQKTYTLPVEPVSLPTDPASLEKGGRYVKTLCAGCHGPDLGGVLGWFKGGPLGTVDSANLTSGQGGIGREFTSTEDYVRAIRHGLDPEGKPIFMTAVVAFSHMSDEDLGAIIAYIKTLPPVDRETGGQNLSALTKVLIGAGVFGNLPVESVDHAMHVSAPAPAVNVEYGGYLASINDCSACHGKQLAGGKYPDPTVKVLAPNLTPGGELGSWGENQFLATIRTGKTPSGHELNNQYMPWKDFSNLTDDELKAIWLYLQAQPKLPTQIQ